ncbi:hypothetical protein DXG01_006719 [Tephrocybe rancida]|nr:hypothetical protein DXG01_006719 [Tephrocybe rancida]
MQVQEEHHEPERVESVQKRVGRAQERVRVEREWVERWAEEVAVMWQADEQPVLEQPMEILSQWPEQDRLQKVQEAVMWRADEQPVLERPMGTLLYWPEQDPLERVQEWLQQERDHQEQEQQNLDQREQGLVQELRKQLGRLRDCRWNWWQLDRGLRRLKQLELKLLQETEVLQDETLLHEQEQHEEKRKQATEGFERLTQKLTNILNRMMIGAFNSLKFNMHALCTYLHSNPTLQVLTSCLLFSELAILQELEGVKTAPL